ncbi:MAG: hypothetical protein GVY22_16485 [Gammaproteobacteria bacterium]|jgi:hypothetical protein|nr:hypothetical protein [Gammaproteobacteria bacterium]
MPKPLRLLAGLVLCLCAGLAASALENRVFELEHQRADAVVPQLQDLYGGEIQLSATGQTLVVRAQSERLSEIETLLQRIDRPPRQVQLSLRHRSTAKPSGRDRYSAGVYSTGRDSTRSVTVLDGQVAQISSGRIARVPIAERGGWSPAVLLEEIKMTSGFLIQPSVISNDQVELRITAVQDGPLRGRGDYETADLTTVRRVRSGEWVELGEEHQRRSARGTNRVYGSQLHDNRLWEVKVDVLPAP